MLKSEPLISIITVVFNAVNSVETTIESVLSQTYTNVEYIIIDGGSTDGTVEILNRYKLRLSALISEKDNGIYNAMNKGITLAKGELVGILNADDQYFPRTIELVVKNYLENATDVVHGNLLKKRELEGEVCYKPLLPNFSKMEQSMGVLHPTCFVKKEVYKKYGVYDETYLLSSDYDFFLRLYRAGCSFSYINEPLAIFSLGGASGNEMRSRWEKFHILRKHQTGYHVKELYRIFRGMVLKTAKTIVYQAGFGKLVNNQIKKKWS